MSAAKPFVVSDDDDELVGGSDSELELVDYDSEPEIVGVVTKEASSPFTDTGAIRKKLRNSSIQPPDSELKRYRFGPGCVITAGDTVELKDHSTHEEDAMHSADFLRVKHIIMNLETDEVRLRGHRLRRCKYLGQIFDWKLNELSMVLRVDEADPRCPFIAGMEDTPVSEVLRTRECVLTNKPYPELSFRDGPRCAFPLSLTRKEIKQQMFVGGRLACRVVNIIISKNKAKPHAGIIRHLYAREADIGAATGPAHEPGLSREEPISLDDDEDGFVMIDKKRHATPNSAGETLRKPKLPLPTKHAYLTFGDVFCGAGGASQGARQAGLQIKWGLDFDEHAIEAYQMNNPGALPFRCSAHDFPPQGHTNEELRVDILHLSPPCCYFSPAHTREGPNDQANLEAIYTVGAILEKLQPRVATLEQTFGLSTREQHKANFLTLLRDIGDAGYDVRYMNADLSEYGLVQKRKRLLIIAARRGNPLPPFPKATHGASGSGLKPFYTIYDALVPIQRLAFRPTDDQYHQPKLTAQRKDPYSPHSFLKGCITTSGSTDFHFSGTRRYTPRELSLFQSFPVTYKFTGVQTQATKQIGNAFPPIVAEGLYRTIAKTLEAFDKGYIDAEEDISDLDNVLEKKGAQFQAPPALPRAAFDPPTRTASLPSRYLVRDDRAGPSTPSSNQRSASRPQRPRNREAETIDLLDGLFDGADDGVRETIEVGARRPAHIIQNASQEIVEISSESDEEMDEDSD